MKIKELVKTFKTDYPVYITALNKEPKIFYKNDVYKNKEIGNMEIYQIEIGDGILYIDANKKVK